MKVIAEFEIEGLPLMTNQINRKHWTVKAKEAKKWKNLVFQATTRLGINGLRLQKATLTLTRHSTKEPDFDGLVSGFKHLVDSLVDSEVIVNDKQENIGQPYYRWQKTNPGFGYVTIKIEA